MKNRNTKLTVIFLQFWKKKKVKDGELGSVVNDAAVSKKLTEHLKIIFSN